MGFFQDLKEDLSIAANELTTDVQGGENAEITKEQPAAAADETAKTDAPANEPVPYAEPKADAFVMPEDDMDVMPSAELAKALVEANVVEKQEETPAETQKPKDAVSPDGKPAPVFGEQMELELGGYQDAAPVSETVEETAKPEKKKETKEDTIEKAANELKNIADMMNVKKEEKKEDKKETKMEEVKETVVENPTAQAADQKDAAPSEASLLSGEPMDENAVITACMTVKGDVLSRGSVEIQGVVEGNVTVLGKLNVSGKLNGDAKAAEVFADGAQISGQISADGTAKIGKESVIIGNIYATSAVIAGAVKGDIDVHGPVILDSTAIVMGNIKSKSVQINNGAAIEGMCSQCYADSSPSSFFDKFLK